MNFLNKYNTETTNIIIILNNEIKTKKYWKDLKLCDQTSNIIKMIDLTELKSEFNVSNK